MPSDNELMKMRSGGAITQAEYERLKKMPHKERYGAKGLRKKTGAAATKKEMEAMKPTPAKMKAYATGMRQHIMNSGSKKKEHSTGGGSVGGAY